MSCTPNDEIRRIIVTDQKALPIDRIARVADDTQGTVLLASGPMRAEVLAA